jgi:hypothetical protein
MPRISITSLARGGREAVTGGGEASRGLVVGGAEHAVAAVPTHLQMPLQCPSPNSP